jgi:NADH-quinone oxidoreductase subunit H
MTSADIVLSLLKVLVVILFLLNAAAIATWADRRQSAMVQDRVGPNRAVVYLPSWVMRALLFLPGFALGGGALASLALGLDARTAPERMALDAQLAVLVTWVSIVILGFYVRRKGAINAFEERVADADPRTVFYMGLVAHALAMAAVQMVSRQGALVGGQVARGLLAVVLLSGGFYAASRVPEGKVGLRLAGMLHAAADAVKLIWKEDFVPKNADRLLHGLAPMIAMFPALVTFAIVPFGDTLCFTDDGNKMLDWADVWNGLVGAMPASGECAGNAVSLQVADLNVGVLYLFALGSTGVIGAAVAGWSSDNKFSLLGGLRAASQMVSYEVAMGLSLVGLFMITSSVRLGDIVEWQSQYAWGIFVQPVGFFLFLAALAAEGKRVPFDQPEGESEIVAGYFVEYSGMKFGMFFTGEYVELVTSSALLATLFFGGYALPFLHEDGVRIAFGDLVLYDLRMTHLAVTLLSVVAFFGKTIFVVWIQIFFRWTLPRFRYDQLMKLGWTKLLPFAIGNVLLTGLVVLLLEGAGDGVKSSLQVLADVTQAAVGVGMLFLFVAFLTGLLEPVEREKFLKSTTARFAQAKGGVRPEPRQA